jgi:hypothetical protein
MSVTGVGSGLSLAKEVRTVSNATWATNVATLTTSAAHGLAVGARIRVAGVTPSGYNGIYTTTTGTTGSTVKYAKTSDPGAFSAAGLLYSIGMTTTPTRVLQLISESLDLDVAKLETPTLSGGTLFQQATSVRQGRKRVAGDTALLLWTKGEALLFEAMLGAIATTGAGPYTHTATPYKYLPSYTMQVAFGATTDTMVKQATGMMVDSWEIALAAGENATLGLSWVGKDMAFTTGDALDGTAPSGITAYNYVDGTITVGGSSVGCVKNITIAGNNNLASDDMCIGTSVISDQERGQFAEITGTIEFELEATDVSYLTDYVAGTQKTVVLTLANSPSSITITFTMQWQTGITPKVSGTEKLTVSGPFKAYVTSGNTDAQTFSIVSINADSTP